MKTRLLLSALVLGGSLSLPAETLTQSTFTEIIKEVAVVPQATKTAAPAQVNEVVKAPDLVRTGPASRAELTAPDQTITRVGANTVFSFEPAGRNLNLQQGSLLFHSPAGKGGGSIRSGGASAAVLGTTVVVVASQDGGFKVIVLEGKGQATLPNGKSVSLKAGQLVFVLPGKTEFGPLLEINLGKMVGGSQLVNGFAHPIASLPLIQLAVERQNKEIENGKSQDTGVTPDAFLRGKGGKAFRGNGLNTIDDNTYQNLVLPNIRQIQG